MKYYINVVEVQRLSKDRKHEEIQVYPQFLFFLSFLMPSGSLISDSFSAQHCTLEGIDTKGIHLCKDRTYTYKPLNQSLSLNSVRTYREKSRKYLFNIFCKILLNSPGRTFLQMAQFSVELYLSADLWSSHFWKIFYGQVSMTLYKAVLFKFSNF